MCAITLLTSNTLLHFPERYKTRGKKHSKAACLHEDKMSMLCLHVELISVNIAGRQYVE